MVCLWYYLIWLIWQLGQVYFGKPGTSEDDIHVSCTTQECTCDNDLQRQIKELKQWRQQRQWQRHKLSNFWQRIDMRKYVTSGRLREVKNKRKLQTVISKSGRGCLRELPTLLLVIWLRQIWYFGKVWKSGRSRETFDRLREVVARRGSTVRLKWFFGFVLELMQMSHLHQPWTLCRQ